MSLLGPGAKLGFFFSSRRRHTRFKCDWSSDVCSSDLDSTLGPSLTEALRVDLAQSPVVRLLDGAAVGKALGRMGRKSGTALDVALARELAQREGAKAV